MSDKETILDLPSAVETEEDILGTCLQEGNVWWHKVEQAAEGVPIEELFFNNEHRIVAKSMSELYHNKTPITLSTLTDSLSMRRESNILVPTVQGYLAVLASAATLRSLDDLSAAVKVLVEKKKLRSMIIKLRTTVQDATTATKNPNEIADQLRKIATEDSMLSTDIKTFGEQIEKYEAESGLAVSVRASSGIKSLDDRLQGGFGAGSLSIIAARPKVGKTTVMLNAMLQNIQDGLVVVFASLELGHKELYSKMLSSLSLLPQRDIARVMDGNDIRKIFTDDEIVNYKDADEELRSASFYPLFTRDLTHGVDTIIAAAYQAQFNHPDKKVVVYIDYAQLLVEGVQNRTAEIGQVSRKLKIFAQDIDGPVIMAAQVNRDSNKSEDDGMPRPHHLRESGDLEQTADNVIMLNRKSLQDENAPDFVMDVWLALVRTGEAGFCQAYYKADIQYVSDISEAADIMNNAPALDPDDVPEEEF